MSPVSPAWAAVITATASLLWPLLAIAAVFALRGPVRAIVASVGSRGGSVKLGGFEVTVVEAAEQQQVLIADLQLQLGNLQQRLDALDKDGASKGAAQDKTSLRASPPKAMPGGAVFGGPPPPPRSPAPAPDPFGPVFAAAPAPDPFGPVNAPAPASAPIPTRGAGKAGLATRLPERLDELRLLWLEQRPERNAALQEALEGRGARIVNVSSLAAALDALARQDFSAVVAGMSFGGDAAAGIDLVKRVREQHPINPVLIYCMGRERVRYGLEALSAGAAYVTSSPTELLRRLSELAG